MASYEIRSEGVTETIEASDMADAVEQCEGWLREGDWSSSAAYDDESTTTIWPSAYVVGPDGESQRVSIRIDPPAPRCIARGEDHDWRSPIEIVGGLRENPGVRGHGGGVIIHEVCMRCGCSRRTDTWAQDRSTGEQGLESVTYSPREYADEVARMAEEVCP